MSSQDSRAVSKSPVVCSSAVSVPHQVFYPTPGVRSPARAVANYEAVMPGLPYKQVGAGSYSEYVCSVSVFVCY